MKIVVRAPNWIGDCVMALPAIKTLKKNLPDAEIWVAALDWVAGLYASVPEIEGVLSLPSAKGIKGLLTSVSRLKAHAFDAGLLLTNSFHSALVFARANIPERWGYRTDARHLLLTRSIRNVSPAIPHHHVYYYLKLLEGLGFKHDSPSLSLNIPGNELVRMEARLLALGWEKGVPLITLNPGAQYGPAKRWPAERFRSVARMIAEHLPSFFAIVGSGSEIALAEELASEMAPRPASLAGKTTLSELAAVIRLSRLFITNDTGPMHIANALGTPLVAVFGPTDHRITGPFQTPSVLVRKEAPCWPCHYRECPFDHRCMRDIQPEDVFEACLEMIESSKQSLS